LTSGLTTWLTQRTQATLDEIFTTLHGGEMEVFKHFSDTCRGELRKHSVY
jgi:hypothetical protein